MMDKNLLSIEQLYTSLKTMDMLLYKYAYEPEKVVGFESTKDMAIYYRELLHLLLPPEYQYNK